MNEFYYEKRLERMLRMMSDLSIDAAFVVEPAAVQYFTGLNLVYLGRPMPTLITQQGKIFMFALKLEGSEAQHDSVLGDIVTGPADPEKQEAFILNYLMSLRVRKLGIDYSKTPCRLVQRLTDKLGEPRDMESDLARLRAVKDTLELQNIIRAIAATEKAQARAKKMISEGVEEREIASAAVTEILSCGAEWFSFSPLVASGERSAYPHGMPTQKRLRVGEMVFVDLGARVNGYWSDVTRTYTVGHADRKQLKLYSAINEAIEAALDAVKPGVEGRVVDASARAVIRRHGYGKYFIHGVGHGIGLTGGYPMMDSTSNHILEDRQTITIEPGIYIPGYGGIRIEEDVLVTNDGAHQLTSFPRDLE